MKIPAKLRLFLPAFLWLSLFLLAPLTLIALVSFLTRGEYGGILWRPSPANIVRLADPLYLPVFVRSLAFAAGCTLLCALLAFPISYWMARLDKKWQNALMLLVLIPFWTNILVRLYAWMFLLGRFGLFNSILVGLGWSGPPIEVLFTGKAIVLGFVYGHLPFMILPLYAVLEKIDWSLLDAARDLYATPAQAFLKVVVPMSKPGLIAGSALVFASIPCDFVTPELLGGAKNMMIGNLISQQYLVLRDWPFGSTLSLALMVAIGAGLTLYMMQESSAA